MAQALKKKGDADLSESASFSTEHYNAVVGAAQLAQISLRKSEFNVNPRWFETVNRSLECKLLSVHISAEPDDGRTAGEFEWSVFAKNDEGERLLTLTATFLAVYEGLEDQDRVATEAFVSRIGKFTTFPYFRSLVSQFNWLSGAELPVLPVLRGGP